MTTYTPRHARPTTPTYRVHLDGAWRTVTATQYVRFLMTGGRSIT